MKRKTHQSLLSALKKLKRNRDDATQPTTCNPALGLHMEDFREQITAIYLKNKLTDFFEQKKQTLQDLTQSLNSAAVRCLCKIVAPIKPHHVFLSALSTAYSKLFSLYFKFSGEPWASN